MGFLAGVAPARPQLRPPAQDLRAPISRHFFAFRWSGQFKEEAPVVAVPLPAPSLRSPLRSTPRPPSSCSDKLHIMTPAPPPASTRQARASGEFSGKFGARCLALPPVGLGLKWNLFVVRPLFHLTQSPPRQHRSLRTLSQSPSPSSGLQTLPRCRACRSGFESSAGRWKSLGEFRRAKAACMNSGSVTRACPFWLVRERLPLPSSRAASF
jgi:hypothetical protein